MRSPRFLLHVATLVGLGMPLAGQADEPEFKVSPIGHVQKSEEHTLVILDKKYEPGLLGIDGYSHVYIFWWFDRNDTPGNRHILQVHPRGDARNPLTGVFATRAPVRPNLVALTLCRIASIHENGIKVAEIDAFDGTPVIDLKPYIPALDSPDEVRVPDWGPCHRGKRASHSAPADFNRSQPDNGQR